MATFVKRLMIALLFWVFAVTVSDAFFFHGGGMVAMSDTCNFSTAGPNCAPGVANMLLNGAAGDTNDVTVTATIGSGSAALAVGTNTFASTDCQSGAGCTGTVNKGIGVWGAGAGGAILSTSIIAFTDAQHVTLGNNAGTAVTGGSTKIRYGTDNTTAIQTVMNAIAASNNTGVIYLPDTGKPYLVNGTPQNYPNSAGSAILLMPDRPVTSGPINIIFKGQFEAPYGGISVIGSQVLSNSGSILTTTRNDGGGVAAIIGGASANFYPWTLANLGVKNLMFRTYDNPQIIPVDGRYIAGMEVEDVWFDTGTALQNVSAPTDVNAIALATPLNSNGAFTSVRNINVVGPYVGVQINEHAVIDNASVYFAHDGYFVNPANHAMSIGRIGAYHTIVAMEFGSAGGLCAPIDVKQLDIEWTASGPWARTWDIDDITNAGCGTIKWHLVEAGPGPTHTVSVNGGANLQLSETGALIGTVPVVLGQYYVTSALPVCGPANPATNGFQRLVSDAASPTYNGTLVGSGSVRTGVLCNGTNWVTQ